MIFEYKPNISLCPNSRDFNGNSINPPPQLQIDLAPSSRGVGWANGYCGVVTSARAIHCARFRSSRSTPNTISDPALFVFAF